MTFIQQWCIRPNAVRVNPDIFSKKDIRLFAVAMWVSMGLVLSAATVLTDSGMGPGFLTAWAKAFLGEMRTGIPIASVVSPLMTWLFNRLIIK